LICHKSAEFTRAPEHRNSGITDWISRSATCPDCRADVTAAALTAFVPRQLPPPPPPPPLPRAVSVSASPSLSSGHEVYDIAAAMAMYENLNAADDVDDADDDGDEDDDAGHEDEDEVDDDEAAAEAREWEAVAAIDGSNLCGDMVFDVKIRALLDDIAVLKSVRVDGENVKRGEVT
jgi:hypothetical protein